MPLDPGFRVVAEVMDERAAALHPHRDDERIIIECDLTRDIAHQQLKLSVVGAAMGFSTEASG